jgi:pyruvate formate lyase activating enzyme
MREELFGLVANIQRYSVNDGPGIRTTVFLKGCPLRCKWCHNVEMIHMQNEVWYSPGLCSQCGKCVEICPKSAIRGFKDERVIDRDVCIDEACLKCAEICSTRSMTIVARKMTVEHVLKEVRKDEIFYRRDGGVTVSGGEPLSQFSFVVELLKVCQAHSIHTALDTSGYASWNVLSEVARYSDLILFDIKHINSEKHRWGTGVSNELILENATKLVRVAKMRARIPLIPTFNDCEEDLIEIAKFVKSIGLEEVDLLPYHSYAEGKYKMYLRIFEFSKVQPSSEDHLQHVKAIFQNYGLQVTIGG